MWDGRAVIHGYLSVQHLHTHSIKIPGCIFVITLTMGGFTGEGIGGISKSPASAMILFYFFPEDKPAGSAYHGT